MKNFKDANKNYIIGIGGRGSNAINNLKNSKAHFVCANTNENILSQSEADTTILLENSQEMKNRIKENISTADNILLIAGLGGRTGSTAIKTFAECALELNKNVACAVTLPFEFEGAERLTIAEAALDDLRGLGIKVVVYKNQSLFDTLDDTATFSDAFNSSDNTLAGFVEQINNPDFFTVNSGTVLRKFGS